VGLASLETPDPPDLHNPLMPAAVALRPSHLHILGQGGTVAEAQRKALALLDGILRGQASVLAFEKIFLLMGIGFVSALPLLLLFRIGKPTAGGGREMAH